MKVDFEKQRIIGGFDQPFDLGSVQPFYRPAAFAWCFQPEFPACLFDHMLGLVVAQVVLAPELGRFSGDFPQGFKTKPCISQ